MKMLVSDYDDTLFTTEEEIKKNIEAISKFMMSSFFVVATGRSYQDYHEVKTKYHIPSHYVVINHGATILKNEEVLKNITIDDSMKNKIVSDLSLETASTFFACSKKQSRVSMRENDLTKLHVRYSSKEECLKRKQIIIQKYGDKINLFPVYNEEGFEIVAKDANKKDAILEIAKREQIPICNIYAVGDGNSDFQMIKSFHGFSMPSAKKKVKEVAEGEVSSVWMLINQLMKKN